MKRLIRLKSTLLATALAPAQGRARAMFGARGETIGTYSLMRGAGEAAYGARRFFEGTIAGVRSESRGTEVKYRFTLKTEGKPQAFRFTLREDEMRQPDVESLVARRRGVRVRACEDREGRGDRPAVKGRRPGAVERGEGERPRGAGRLA
jgi:hypothetical protein